MRAETSKETAALPKNYFQKNDPSGRCTWNQEQYLYISPQWVNGDVSYESHRASMFRVYIMSADTTKEALSIGINKLEKTTEPPTAAFPTEIPLSRPWGSTWTISWESVNPVGADFLGKKQVCFCSEVLALPKKPKPIDRCSAGLLMV